MQDVNQVQSAEPIISARLHDIEYNGELNRATQQGAKFALLLSMLEQNALFRPHIAADPKVELASDMQSLSYYRSAPISATSAYWHKVVQTEHFIQAGELDNAKLWLAMHPEPLSLLNDAKHIPQEVFENCSLAVRHRFATANSNEVQQEPAGLYDILQEIEQSQPQYVSA